jgi:NAD(P)-dependent dehydrogenase (short-subunit alcohol dehydrogenase family)
MKTAVITGGNSGIGKAVATALAKKGYRVIIHGRDEQKTIRAAEEIRRDSGNTRVEYIAEDVSLISGMKSLAEKIRQKTTSIEALVLSTGIILPKQVITADGLEAGFAIQYLSRFTVAQMLMQELKNGRARIVMVGAPKLPNAEIFFDDIALKENFSMMKALGQEMYANHLFVQEFAKLHPENEIVINMGHVGIANTGIMRHSNFILKGLAKLVAKSPEEAAANFVYLASDPSVDFSGYFLKKPGKPEVREKIDYDPSVAERLWNLSLELIYFKPRAQAAN